MGIGLEVCYTYKWLHTQKYYNSKTQYKEELTKQLVQASFRK